MKKIIILLALVVVYQAVAFSQSTYSVTSTNYAYLNQRTNTWVWQEWNSVDMTATFTEGRIRITDRAGSVYTTYGQMVEKRIKGGKSSSWSSYDEDNRNCRIELISWDDRSAAQLYIVYKDYRYSYNFEK